MDTNEIKVGYSRIHGIVDSPEESPVIRLTMTMNTTNKDRLIVAFRSAFEGCIKAMRDSECPPSELGLKLEEVSKTYLANQCH